MDEPLYKTGEIDNSLNKKPADVIQQGMFFNLFTDGLELSPNLSEVYELALAYYESRILTKKELLESSAYFVKVDNVFTNHFYICTGDPVKIPEYSSSRLKSFFINNQFRTGYSTHGLFPYRGKFHPQMIKALINIMGIKPGETILDPMMGSGTVPAEASLMGIKSIGIDSSPFCRFMAQVKCDSLKITPDCLDNLLNKYKNIFLTFNSCPKKFSNQKDAFYKNNYIEESVDKEEIFNLVFLAFLDSEGYAQRSKRKSHLEHFKSIFERYLAVVNKILAVENHLKLEPANTDLLQGDARKIDIENNSIDGIIFSPPYSFAIDYLKNDFSHLGYFVKDISKLNPNMIGMRGKALKEKYHFYIEDMDKVISECYRVLKPGRFCTIIIGTNDSQLSKALKIPRNEVSGLNTIIKKIGIAKGFSHVRSLPRQIVGMANTMRQEYIVILQKNGEK